MNLLYKKIITAVEARKFGKKVMDFFSPDEFIRQYNKINMNVEVEKSGQNWRNQLFHQMNLLV